MMIRISVYCDRDGSNCDGVGDWMKVGYLNISDPGTTSPPGLTLRQSNNNNNNLCGRPMSSSILCSAHGLYYNNICGILT